MLKYNKIPSLINTLMNESKSFSCGNFSLPMNTICSKKCAKPGTSLMSLKLPTPIHRPVAAFKQFNIVIW